MKIRDYFPILNTKVHGYPLVYLDNAATMQMPDPVLRRIQAFYCGENANIHRGIHSLSEGATAEYEQVRQIVCRFLDAPDPEEIIFTSGTTASINLAAQMLEPFLSPGDEILVTAMEHHSNLLPWMELKQRKELVLKVVPVLADGTLNLDALQHMVGERTKVAAITEVSNVSGIRNPLHEILAVIRSASQAWTLVDGAQGVVHERQGLRALQPDFYCFSGHKLGAPTGTGVLYVRKELQKQFHPVWFGGGIVHSVAYNAVSYVEGPSLYEPGTPNYTGTVGLGAALQFWMSAECSTEEGSLAERERQLLGILEEGLNEIPGIHILGEGRQHFGCLSFVSEQMHAYDLCRLLDHYGIAVRSGHMCAQPYLEAMGCEHAIRVSVAPYNTPDEIRYFIRRLQEILNITRYQREIADSTAMPMQDLEKDILSDLGQLKDPMDQYSFLMACAGEALPFPEDYRTEQYLIRECQMNTWVYTDMVEGKCVFLADSESLVVKGVLALLQEIYFGRSAEEMCDYSCGLLTSPLIREHLNQDQLKGLEAIVEQLSLQAKLLAG